MSSISYLGSLRYGPTGKKRKSYYKTKSLSSSKISKHFKADFKSSYVESDRIKQIREHHEKYPSFTGHISGKGTRVDNSYKVEVSKNFTIAPAYNKGAYQVIPRKEIECIGK
jgi:hypothetical protein